MEKPVTFICKRSGNPINLYNVDDIAQLRKHEGYTEVKDEKQAEATPEKNAIENAKKEVLIAKKRGRPKKNRL